MESSCWDHIFLISELCCCFGFGRGVVLFVVCLFVCFSHCGQAWRYTVIGWARGGQRLTCSHQYSLPLCGVMGNQATKLGSMHLYLLSHLNSPLLFLKFYLFFHYTRSVTITPIFKGTKTETPRSLIINMLYLWCHAVVFVILDFPAFCVPGSEWQ